MSTLPDAEALLPRLADGLRELVTPELAMIGLYTGGAWLAERLHAMLGLATPLGLMDIAFYRDDYNKQGLKHDPKRTKIPFDVEGRDLLLVDDVLYTGRTIRAALDELADFGRPARISLAVLIDRGGRELPIQPDVVGKKVSARGGDRVDVQVEELDGKTGVVLVSAASR